jgi:hypothetical protein
MMSDTEIEGGWRRKDVRREQLVGGFAARTRIACAGRVEIKARAIRFWDALA